MATKRRTVRRAASRFVRRVSHKPKFTLPLAVIAGFAGPVSSVYSHTRSYGVTGVEGGVGEFSRIMTGFNPYDVPAGFQFYRMRYGLLPIMLGLSLHKVAGWVGLNRMLARSGIPVIRI